MMRTRFSARTGYNKDGLLNSVTDFAGNQITITSNSDGLPSAETLGSTGDSLGFTYDQADAPSAIALTNSSGATVQSFTYSDAPDGAVVSEADVPASAQSPAGYTYDTQGRVTSMSPGSHSPLNYGYDPSGNLTTLPTGATNVSYDKASELTAARLNGTTTSYTYNADGERLAGQQGSAQTSSGTWDGAGNLTAYSASAGAMSSATYDGNGFRAADNTNPAGGSASAEQFVWDKSRNRLLMDSSNAYIYVGHGAPAEQVNLATGTITYLISDSLGSARGTVNSAGALTASTAYDAWGNPETTAGLTASTPFGYAGGYTDTMGLIYLIHRYYDPATGQFLSVDPEVSQTGQPYSYAGDNPVNATDPTGQWTVDAVCNCGSNSERVFEVALAGIFATVGRITNGRVFMEPYTKMLPIYGTTRIPDFYWLRTDWGWGWINEVKVGVQTPRTGQTGIEAVNDAKLLAYAGGTGENTWDRNDWMPVDWAIWWFFPNAAHHMDVSWNLWEFLDGNGINMVAVGYNHGAKVFPRSETTRQKKDEVKKLESGDSGQAQAGANEMLAPCPMVCWVPHR
jgi:RHS repeat-associated protein